MIRRLFFVLVTLLATASFAQDVSGTWTANLRQEDRNQVNFQFTYDGSRHSQLGSDIPLAELNGLSLESLTSAGSDVKFSLQREAGVAQFDGHFRDSTGVGKFTFTADRKFLHDMADLGYADIPPKRALEMAVINVNRAHTRELKELGFKLSLDELVEAHIFNVNRQQVEDLKALGYDHPRFQKLVELRVHGVTPEYIKAMRAAGFDEDLDRLVEMRIHGVTPEFKQQMAAAGFPNLGAEKLVEFRVHGITPDFVQSTASLGFRNLSADELVELKIFGVNKDQVEELKSLGYTGLSAKQLVELRVHGIDRRFIDKVHQAGYKNPSIDELVEMKIMGIRRNPAML
jgi:hypothetical protein